MEERINELLGRLTLEEKVALTTGRDYWTTRPVERLGIPSIWLSDGPHGVRKIRSSDDMGLGDAIIRHCKPAFGQLRRLGHALAADQFGDGIDSLCREGDDGAARRDKRPR